MLMRDRANLRRYFRYFLPIIRIHTWGGYGSQLYGVYLTYELEERFPFRRCRVIVHSSGITERTSEIAKYADIQSIPILDFKQGGGSESELPGKILVRNAIKARFRQSLIQLGILSEANGQDEIKRIKPWVLSLRGHYTRLTFKRELLLRLYRLVEENTIADLSNREYIGIQYRLGDLISLKIKSPITPDAIVNCFQKIDYANCRKVRVHSDSLELAGNLLRPLMPADVSLEGVTAPADATIIELSNCKYFVGTSSKVSVWISVFRVILFDYPNTFMHKSFQPELVAHGANELISYYE